MNLLYKIICSILIIANFSNFNTATAATYYQYIPVPILTLKIKFPVINLNDQGNIANIFSEILSTIHAILNYHNQINIAVHAFVQTGHIVDYNRLNSIRMSELWKYKENFVSVLYSNYYITIGNTATLSTVSNELCDIHLRNAIWSDNVELANRVLRCSLQRALDNTNAMQSGKARISCAPYISKRQMFNYLVQAFPDMQGSISRSMTYLNNCLSYLNQYFDRHLNPNVVNLSYQMKDIINQVLNYLYAERDCLNKLQYS